MAKCRLGPTTRIKYLGIIIDSVLQTFSLPSSRVERLRLQVREMSAITRSSSTLPARSVAQLVGLLWAISPCCPRAVSVMARGLVAVLSNAMQAKVWSKRRGAKGHRAWSRPKTLSLKKILAHFWDGDVRWSRDAEADLAFWRSVDFATLRAPISSDTLEALAATSSLDVSHFDHSKMAFMASDASETACGGGLLRSRPDGTFEFDPEGTFFSPLSPDLVGASSGLRELVAIFWMLRAMLSALPGWLVVFTDSHVACCAIRRGSRSPALQAVARAIFVWCLRKSIVLFPCWSPRESEVISEADRRSRWRDVYGDRTPPRVFAAADRLAVRLWGRRLSFDRQASHLNRMPPPGMGPPLPYNALWNQPDCAGVDMFLQPMDGARTLTSCTRPPRRLAAFFRSSHRHGPVPLLFSLLR